MFCENRAWFSLTVVAILSFITAVSTSAGVPQRINYQGRLTDSVTGEPEVGSHNVIFRIYDDATSGTLLWSESQTVQTDSIGVFSAVMGSVTPIDVALIGPVWLEVEVGSEVLSPRREMVSVPFAFRAEVAERSQNSDSLGGYVASDFIREGETSVITSEMIVDGTGSGLDADMLDGLDADAFADSGHVHDDRYYRQTELNSSGSINQGSNPVDWTKLKNVPGGFADGTDDIGGVGDGHSLDAADGSPTDVVYVDNAGEVGIGTTSPACKLDVRGTLNVGTEGSGHDVNLYGYSSGRMFWDESKMALRAGFDQGDHWSDAHTGYYSAAFGNYVTASGSGSFASGLSQEASGSYSVAMGEYSTAEGRASVALGSNAGAHEPYSVAMGRYCGTTHGDVAIGTYVIASAGSSFVMGRGAESSQPLVNRTPNSLMVGFGSDESALFVGGPNNYVGIGTDEPLAPLHTPGPVLIGEYFAGPGSHFGLMIAADDNTDFSVPLGILNQAHDPLVAVQGDGDVGIGASVPLTRCHISDANINLGSEELYYDVLVVEDSDAILGLYSSGAGSAGSAITFGEVAGASLVDKWAILRETTGNGDSGLRFTYGPDNDQFDNDVVMYLDDTRRVGIRTRSVGSYELYVAGDAYATGGWTPSDLRFKQDIEEIESALDKVLDLRGILFRWKTEEYGEKGFPEGRHYGVIAQEAEEVLPEIVKEGPDGEKAVAYSEIIPVLIESIKELKAENEALKERLESIEMAVGLGD